MHSNFRLILWLVIGATLVASLFDVLQIHFERERLRRIWGAAPPSSVNVLQRTFSRSRSNRPRVFR